MTISKNRNLWHLIPTLDLWRGANVLHSRAKSQSVAEATLEREEGNPFSPSVSKDNKRKLESDGFHYQVTMFILLMSPLTV